MVKYKIGYLYSQRYTFDDKTGFTRRCVLHTLNEAGEIVKTFDYKCGADMPNVGTVCGAPLFDKFGRLCGFNPVKK